MQIHHVLKTIIDYIRDWKSGKERESERERKGEVEKKRKKTQADKETKEPLFKMREKEKEIKPYREI